MVRTMLEKLKPKFWDHVDVAAGPFHHLFNFRRIWKLAFFSQRALLSSSHFHNRHRLQSHPEFHRVEMLLRTSRLVSNTGGTISFFLPGAKIGVGLHHEGQQLSKT